jgi:RNA polymerase sigma-B factor
VDGVPPPVELDRGSRLPVGDVALDRIEHLDDAAVSADQGHANLVPVDVPSEDLGMEVGEGTREPLGDFDAAGPDGECSHGGILLDPKMYMRSRGGLARWTESVPREIGPVDRTPTAGGAVERDVGTTEIRSLLRRYREHGDLRARESLIAGFAPVVRRIARRFEGRGEALEDLVQVGMVGLIKAVDRFDPGREVAFSTYAFPCIIGEIKRHLRDRVWDVGVPRPVKDLAVRLPREQERLSALLGHSPTVRELAEALEADEEQTLEALDARQGYKALSLSATVGDSDDEPDLLGQIGGEDEGYERCEERLVLHAGFEHLDQRERRVLLLRFAHGLTQSEIAVQLGFSQMHISRIIRKALEKLGTAVVEAPAGAS